ncbi:MAG: hypothetical protein GKR95_23570 [Gammaproteobacteria bacterium]|nr:hypothetical protein [Gammaproteobacteria bacterium]
MTAITFTPISGSFGREVHGIDIALGLDDEQLFEMTNIFVKHQFLLIRNQNITESEYAAFGRRWSGKTRIDSFTEMHLPGYDDINIIGNVGELFQDEEYRNGASFWHTDCAAEPDPDATTMLFCIHAPEADGETVLADMQSAYDDLEPNLKQQIQPLVARHCYAGAKTILGGRYDWEHTLTPVTEETARRFPPPVVRPLVRDHTITGRPGLYAPAGSIFSIDGMDQEYGDRLMAKLKAHVTQPKYCYAHQYKPGDILMWGNTSTMHFGKATQAATNERDQRLLYRISPLGLPVGLTAK